MAKTPPTDPRDRFEDFAARFGAKARHTWGAAHRTSREPEWREVQELFTRDLTGKGLQELFGQETNETVHFFTREVPLGDLKGRPWHQRYPLTGWRVFLAVAHRLAPWRRVLFALAVPVVAFAWLRYLASVASQGVWGWAFPPIFSLEGWLLLSASSLLFLLVLELRDKLSLKGDLEIARQIQFGLLPFAPYVSADLRIDTVMRPANTVGGDYFDLIDLGGDRLAVVIGDVAGKGMPAALLMALLQGSLRTLITAGLRGAEVVQKLNAHLCANIPSNRLVTFFYGELDRTTGVLDYVNAGHNPPFILREDGLGDRLAPTAIALGILPEATFELFEAELEPGDRMLLYTDGVTEAANARDEEYGEARVLAWLREHRAYDGRALIEGLIDDVVRFASPVRPRDDMTLMAVSRL
jgi:sigma-B regulation protein RsbU (phosphoserine phosphatase)